MDMNSTLPKMNLPTTSCFLGANLGSDTGQPCWCLDFTKLSDFSGRKPWDPSDLLRSVEFVGALGDFSLTQPLDRIQEVVR